MNTEFFLLRHGEPQLKGALLGTTDSPLNQKGWQQLEQSFDALDEIQQVVTSPLSRCVEFAKSVAEKKNINLCIEPDWQECHFGEWDGLLMDDIQQRFPEQLAQFFEDPANHMPPESEDFFHFSERVEATLYRLVDRYAGQKVAVITHAGVIRTLVAWCLQMDYQKGIHFQRFSVAYGSVTQLSFFQDKSLYPLLVSLNQQPQNLKFNGDVND